MTKRSNLRASMMGLVLSTMLSIPSVAVAQMSGGMGHDKMMPMGEGKMEGEMKMPAKMPPKKPGCHKMKGAMKAKCEKGHHHPVKAKPVAAKKAPVARPKAATAAKPATATQKPMARPMPQPMPKPMDDGTMDDKMPMPEKMPAKKPGCC